jgi:hypothetical protein
MTADSVGRGLGGRDVKRRALVVLGGALIAAATLAAIGEGGAAADVGDAGKSGPTPSAKIPPDPPALSERMQWVFDLRWERGEVYLVQIHKTDMGQIHPTPRVMGRFALELYEGPTLIERARFDFPMLGSYDAPDGGWKGPARFEPKLKTRIGVLFPATKRGTRLELWDRASDRRWPLPWPPQEGVFRDPPRPAADAGPDGS